jgi:hypothetical protein
LERNLQVRNTDLIFKGPFRVIIWLGRNDSSRFCVPGPAIEHSISYQAFSSFFNVVNAWRECNKLIEVIAAATHSPCAPVDADTVSTSHSILRTGSVLQDGPQRKPGVKAVSVAPVSNSTSLSQDSFFWNKLLTLYSVSWFKRLWIIQEVALARFAIVVWGNYEISWEWVGLAAAILRTNYTRIPTLQNHRKL